VHETNRATLEDLPAIRTEMREAPVEDVQERALAFARLEVEDAADSTHDACLSSEDDHPIDPGNLVTSGNASGVFQPGVRAEGILRDPNHE
jgi:hypothetical protein